MRISRGLRSGLAPEPVQVAQRAQAQALQAAGRSGVDVVPLTELDQLRAASDLFDRVWGTGGNNVQMPPELMRALVHSGNYAAGAYDGGEMAGAVVGVLGHDGRGFFLHSHILGVSSERRGANVGFALKQHQRAWSLRRGITKVTWTFDPLVRRNAHFNVQKLGADVAAYYESFYGVMHDQINAGDDTDRLYVSWRLDAERADEANTSRLHEPDADRLIASGAAVVCAEDGSTAPRPPGADVLLCSTPADVIELRRGSPQEASRWRRAQRAALGEALRDGYAVTGFTRSGWYVLERHSGQERD